MISFKITQDSTCNLLYGSEVFWTAKEQKSHNTILRNCLNNFTLVRLLRNFLDTGSILS